MKPILLFLALLTLLPGLHTARADFYLVTQSGTTVNVVTDPNTPLKTGQAIAPCTAAQAQAAAAVLVAANPATVRETIQSQMLALFNTQTDPTCVAICLLNKQALTTALNDPTIPLPIVKAMVAAINPQGNAAATALQTAMLALFP